MLTVSVVMKLQNLIHLVYGNVQHLAELDPAFHNLTEDDFEESFNVGSFAIGQETMLLKDIYSSLNKIYCGSIGAEYMHMTNTEQKRWIQQRLESVVGQPKFTN